MIRLLWAIIAAVVSGCHSQGGLMIENLALRQQLSTVLQKRRPRIGLVDRAFWVVLRRLWTRWSETVVIVKPETVIGWHRARASASTGGVELIRSGRQLNYAACLARAARSNWAGLT